MSVSIQLHPLAVLNISDHLTRAKYIQGKETNYRVIGALLGKQHGRSLDIVNTVEIKFAVDPKDKTEIRERIDEAFCQQRLEAYKKLFPDLECIGWYSAQKGSSDYPIPGDAQLHKRFQKFTENPLLAILNPESVDAITKKVLPLYLYELEATGGGFIRLDYSLATSDSERIAVDHVAKAIDSSTQATTSQLAQNMTASMNALKTLRRKIRFLVDVVRNSPAIRADHHFMRKLQQICAQLPIASREDFDGHAFSDYADVSAVNLLATVLKGEELLNGLVDDFKQFSSGDRFGMEPGDGDVAMEGLFEEGIHPMMRADKPKGGFFNRFK